MSLLSSIPEDTPVSTRIDLYKALLAAELRTGRVQRDLRGIAHDLRRDLRRDFQQIDAEQPAGTSE